MIVPRIKATIEYADGSKIIIDRIHETTESAQAEYDALIGHDGVTASGNVLYEMCDHFGAEDGCQLVSSKSWGETDE
jgi:hypothetical protein